MKGSEVRIVYSDENHDYKYLSIQSRVAWSDQ